MILRWPRSPRRESEQCQDSVPLNYKWFSLKDTSSAKQKPPDMVHPRIQSGSFVQGISGEFMVKCDDCTKYIVHSIKDLKDVVQEEMLMGDIHCEHCNALKRVGLVRCFRCNSGWSHHEGDPVATVPHPLIKGAVVHVRIGSDCPVCKPQLRENVLRTGKL